MTSPSPNSRTFKLRGKTYRLSKADVERAAAKVEPRSTEKYSVTVGGRPYPPKQLIEISLHLAPMAFTTMDAQRILNRLGFEVLSSERAAPVQTDGKKIEASLWSDWTDHLSAFQTTNPERDHSRALRLKNWIKDTWFETRARDFFQSYLFASGLGKSVLQREPQEGKAIPDFVLSVHEQRIALEVKELVTIDFDIASDVEIYDPCRPVRDRITVAEQELSSLHDVSRCLVLYSRCTPWPIFDWRLIYGAIRDSGDAFQRTTNSDRTADPAEQTSRPSALDAVIVLDQLRTGYLRFRAHVGAQESKIGRPLSDTEYVSELHKARGTEKDIVLSRLRVIVHENPDGANPLPKEIFRGPYDEWYGVGTGGQIGRTFVGEEIRSLEKDAPLRAS